MTDTSNVEVEIGGEEQNPERQDEGEATPEELQEKADEAREDVS